MPPKTQRKLNPTARAELGAERECDECGEVKLVDNKAYAQKNTGGKRGWSTTCRVCQGVRSKEQGAKPKQKTISKFGDDIGNQITEMYLLAETNRSPARVEEIGLALREEIRRLHEAGDDKRSLMLFIDVVKPLVAGWMEPGEIHEDIIDGLLSEPRGIPPSRP